MKNFLYLIGGLLLLLAVASLAKGYFLTPRPQNPATWAVAAGVLLIASLAARLSTARHANSAP